MATSRRRFFSLIRWRENRIRRVGGRSPGGQRGRGLQRVGVADHLVQVVDDLAELGPVVALLLPAVQHELVQHAGAVHGGGQPVVLLDGGDDLQGATESSVRPRRRRRGRWMTERRALDFSKKG